MTFRCISCLVTCQPFPVFRYRLRSKVEIDNVSENFACWQRFGRNLVHTEPSTQEPEAQSIGWGQGVDHAGETAAQANGHGWLCSKILGWITMATEEFFRPTQYVSNLFLGIS